MKKSSETYMVLNPVGAMIHYVLPTTRRPSHLCPPTIGTTKDRSTLDLTRYTVQEGKHHDAHELGRWTRACADKLLTTYAARYRWDYVHLS